MSPRTDSRVLARVLVPTGMLGGGFPPETLDRGIALGADVIAVDGGSTDSGPHYLGAGVAKTSESAVARDVRLLVEAAHRAGIPIVIGSCGTSGTDSGVDWVAAMVRKAAADLGIGRTIARVYSEQHPDTIIERLRAGQVRPLPPAGELTETDVLRCSHIVGLMGHKPIAAALAKGADIVLAGRSTDTALVAALPLARGCPPGPVWHAAKIGECGGLCTTAPTAGGVLISFDSNGFTIEPLSPGAACTPRSVAAHMLYENGDPQLIREPDGTLDTSAATYVALDERTVRVEGSAFVPQDPTIKLEGSAPAGYETMSLVGIRDPAVLADIATWDARLRDTLQSRVDSLLGLGPGAYEVAVRYYGWNAVLGTLDSVRDVPHEVGVILRVRAGDQATATSIAKIANPLLLHLDLPGTTELPSFAFLTSPAEVERGLSYEFLLQHAVSVADESDLFRTEYEEIAHA